MLIVQLFDLQILNLKLIPHWTQKTMETIATKFKSITSRAEDVCNTMYFLCSGPFQWNNLDYFCQDTHHKHPKTTAKLHTPTSVPWWIMTTKNQHIHLTHYNNIHKSIFSYSGVAILINLPQIYLHYSPETINYLWTIPDNSCIIVYHFNVTR